MNLDAVVWLVAGIGVGMGVSLMLLIVYAGLERMRLGRRLKRARAVEAIAAPRPVEAAMALAPVVAEEPVAELPSLDEEPRMEEAPIADAPEPEPEELVEPAPVEVSEPKFLVVAESLNEEPQAPPPPTEAEGRARNVEDIFARAFAQDRPGKPAPDEPEGEGKA